METKDAELLPTTIGGSELALTTEREFGGYQGLATVALNPDQIAELKKPLPEDALDILPTGEIYASQVHYRRLLNSVFGPGAWALVPRGPYSIQGNTITREYALFGPGGRFISEAIGEAEYQPNNIRMSYASACEAAKSNALTRCCKDLGIASECWDKRFCEQFKVEHCIAVWRPKMDRPQWRRRDAQPWFDEKGEAKPRTGAPTPTPAPSREPGGDDSGPTACPHCQSTDIGTATDGAAFCRKCRKGI